MFLDRPHGTPAVAIGGGDAALETAVRAVLQTEAGGVLVKSIRRAADGSYTGEVYGVTPRQRRVAVGDVVTFSEAQIFTFKAPDGEVAATAADEVTAMARTFERQFALLDAQLPPETPAPVPVIPEFSLPPDGPVVIEAATPRYERQPERAEPVLAAAPKPAQREARVEPVQAAPPPRPEPPPAAPPTPVEASGSCVECGAPLTRVARPEDTGEPLQTSKVTCRKCGRINVVATLAYRAATPPSG